MIGLGSIPGAERDIVRVRKWALLSAVGWPPQGLAGRVFVRGIVLVCAPLDVHGWRGRVRVPLPRLWVVSSVDRAPGYEPGCRRFESRTAHGHKRIKVLWRERRGPHGMKELKDAGSSPATPKGPPCVGWKHE